MEPWGIPVSILKANSLLVYIVFDLINMILSNSKSLEKN